MALTKEQLRPNGNQEINSGKVRKSLKKQYNKYIRRKAKNINNEHPKHNRYKGWAN